MPSSRLRTGEEIPAVETPPITPVEAGTSRPRWSVMIPVHDCAHFLGEALASVLSQDPGSDLMQIEVVDDHSTRDDPAKVVEEMGRGRVSFYRQPQNVGHVHNFNTCLRRSHGQLVHILHGDDAVRPGFYDRLGRAFEESAEIGAAFCRTTVIGEDGTRQFEKPLLQTEPGVLRDRLRRIAEEHPILTPSIVVKRVVYEQLGGFDPRYRFAGEDLEMWFRIAARFPVWYEPEPLALYRTHPASLTGQAANTAANIREARMAVETFRAHLPARERDEIMEASLRNVALWALQLSRTAMAAGSPVIAYHHLREALRCNASASVLGAAAGVVGYGIRRQGRRLRRELVRRVAPRRAAPPASP